MVVVKELWNTYLKKIPIVSTQVKQQNNIRYTSKQNNTQSYPREKINLIFSKCVQLIWTYLNTLAKADPEPIPQRANYTSTRTL